MKNLFGNMLIEGIEEIPVAYMKRPNKVEKVNFLNVGSSFLQELSENKQMFNTSTPFLVNNKIMICSCFTLVLEPNTWYEVYGYLKEATEDTIIYLSEVQEDKKLKDTIIETINFNDLDVEGNFTFSKPLRYEKITKIAVWTQSGFILTNLKNFYASIRLAEPPSAFKYAYKIVEMPNPLPGHESEDISSSIWNVNVEGKLNSVSDKDFILNLVISHTDGIIPESYVSPSDGNYGSLSEETLNANVLKGLSELDNGQLEVSESNENFKIFSLSLSQLTDTNKLIPAGEDTFSFEVSWGYPKDSNFVIVWSPLSNDNLFFHFEDLVDDDTLKEDIHGDKDGISWSKSCLAGHTLITMADGSQKRMDAIQVGEKVLSQGEIIDTVRAVKRGFFSKYHTLYYFDDGTIIDETHHHRFFNKTQGLWQRMSHWNIGDVAVNAKGKEIRLIKKEKVEEQIESFGIFTDSGTYYANGLLSGAAKCNKKLLNLKSPKQSIKILGFLALTILENIVEIIKGE